MQKQVHLQKQMDLQGFDKGNMLVSVAVYKSTAVYSHLSVSRTSPADNEH